MIIHWEHIQLKMKLVLLLITRNILLQNAVGLNDDANGDGVCDLMLQGICTIVYVGDNHLGYMGYRSSINPHPVYNSGAIGLVADDWRSENN